jgi:hypothetical protein
MSDEPVKKNRSADLNWKSFTALFFHFFAFSVRGRKKVHFLAPFLGSPRPNSSTTCSFTPLFLALWVIISLSDHLQQQYLGSELKGSSFASKTGEKV